MKNHYESPQTTEHLNIPVAECNHIKHCNDCKSTFLIMFMMLVLCFGFIIFEIMIINQVRKFENKYQIQVYEREFKWEHLRGPE